MIRPSPGAMRVIRLFFVLMMAGSAFFGIKRFFPGSKPPVTAAPGLSEVDDRDGDGRLDPLAVRRLSASPAGEPILAAIDAAGGWEAWAAHRSVSYTLEGVFFDARGLITARGTERHTLRLDGAARIRIDPQEGRGRFGYGAAGAWVAQQRTDGRWQEVVDAEAWPPARLRDLTWRVWWMFGAPFTLSDPVVDLQLVEPDSFETAMAPFMTDPPESTDTAAAALTWVTAGYPPAVGDSTGVTYRLGFEPVNGRLAQIDFAADPNHPERDRMVVRLAEFQETGGLVLPTLRTLYEEITPGGQRFRLYVARLRDFAWDAAPGDTLFEPPTLR